MWRAASPLAMGMVISAVLLCGRPMSALAQQSAAAPDTVNALDAPQQAVQLSTTANSAAPNLWIYLIALGLAMVMGGVYLVRRARANHYRALYEEGAEVDAPPEEARPVDTQSETLKAIAQRLAQSSSDSLGALAIQSDAGSPLFALRTEGPQRECPHCHRRFASWMAICPFDAEPLREPGTSVMTARRVAAKQARASKEDVLPRLRCTTCERRYHQGALHCGHDGGKLVPDLLEDAQEAQARVVCRGCGRDTSQQRGEPSCECKEEHRDVVTLDPASLTERGLSMSICPSCRVYGSPGQTHCKGDGELLLPESVIDRNAFPVNGFGPRRKLCRKCGGRFSGAFVYCTQDGARLTPID